MYNIGWFRTESLSLRALQYVSLLINHKVEMVIVGNVFKLSTFVDHVLVEYEGNDLQLTTEGFCMKVLIAKGVFVEAEVEVDGEGPDGDEA